MTVRIGFNIHPTMTGAEGKDTRLYSAEEKNRLSGTLQLLRPSANLVLSNTDMALQIADELPESLTVLRFYHDREGDFYNLTAPNGLRMAQHLFNAYSPWRKRNNIVINMGNESSSYVPEAEIKRQSEFYADACTVFGDANTPIAVSGWATGHPDLNRLYLFDALWRALKKYPMHYLAIHEYFSYRGVEIGNGRIGRHWAVAQWVFNNYGFVPNMLVTEHGGDDIDGKFRGWQSWNTSNVTRQAEYFAMLKAARRESYNVPWIKGVMIYSWGDSNGWPDFDVSKAYDLHGMLRAENIVNVAERALFPPVTPPVVEPPVVIPPVVVDRAPALIAELKLLVDKYK